MVRKRDLQGKGPSSILVGGFLSIFFFSRISFYFFFSRNTSNNSEVYQYQFENFFLEVAAIVYERENCLAERLLYRLSRRLNLTCTPLGYN